MQLVLVDVGTLNILHNETYDVVSRHEDDVDLTGKGYETFRIVRINGLSLDQVNVILNPKIPEKRIAYKTISKPSKWTFIEPEENDIEERKIVWRHTDGDWYFLEDKPKYSINIPFSVAAIGDLGNITILENIKIQLINGVAREKIHLKPVNMTKVRDLN